MSIVLFTFRYVYTISVKVRFTNTENYNTVDVKYYNSCKQHEDKENRFWFNDLFQKDTSS